MAPTKKLSQAAQQALEQYPDLPYIDNQLYRERGFASLMEQPPPGLEESLRKHVAYDGELAKICAFPVLTREQERHLFQQMNYFLMRAATLRARIERGNSRYIAEFRRAHRSAAAAKNTLVLANTRLIVNFLKKRFHHLQNVFEKLSDCLPTLFKCIDKFDWSKGNKFSTYVTTALIRSATRDLISDLSSHSIVKGSHGKEVNYLEDDAPILDYREPVASTIDTPTDELEAVFARAIREDGRMARSITIIKARNGIGCERQSLKQIGDTFNLTRERIRQIQSDGMRKLQKIAAAIDSK